MLMDDASNDIETKGYRDTANEKASWMGKSE